MKCLFCDNLLEIKDTQTNNVVCPCKAVNVVWIDGTHCAVKPREEGDEMFMDILATGKNTELAKRWLRKNVNHFLERHLKELDESTD